MVAVFQVSENLKCPPSVYHCFWDGVKAAKWNSMGLMQDFISPVELGPFCTWCNVVKRNESECGAQHGWSFPSKHQAGTLFILCFPHSKPCHHWIGHLFMPCKSWRWVETNIDMLLCPAGMHGYAWMQLHCHLLHERIDAGWQVLQGVFKQERAEHSRSRYIWKQQIEGRNQDSLILVVWIQDFGV